MSHSDTDPVPPKHCPHGAPHLAECVLCDQQEMSEPVRAINALRAALGEEK